MWRLVMFLLCLVAALAGTPLRQAEAAEDIARWLDESGDGNELEMVDGGVGDDSGETVLRAGDGDHVPPAAIALAWLDAFILPTASPRPSPDVRGPDDRAGPGPAGSARRHAWLQCFLF